MKLNYQDKCGYQKQSWNNLYFPIFSYLYLISILLHLWLKDGAHRSVN